MNNRVRDVAMGLVGVAVLMGLLLSRQLAPKPQVNITRPDPAVFASSVRDAYAPGSTSSPTTHLTAPIATPTAAKKTPTLDLNTATARQLERLPRVGEALAAAIVAHREKNGGFNSVAELEQVPGIGPRMMELLAPLVTVGAYPPIAITPTPTQPWTMATPVMPIATATPVASPPPITIPTQVAPRLTPHVVPSRQPSADAPININTATLKELMELVGIGEVKAQAIIDYRHAHGPFRSIEELENVKGIGAKTIDKNRGRMTVR